MGPWDRSRGPIGLGVRGDKLAIRLGQADFHEDSYNFFAEALIVEGGLLGAVVGLTTGVLDHLEERGTEFDGIDVRTRFRRWKLFDEFRKQPLVRPIVALPEEVSFSNRFAGKRSLEGEQRRHGEQRCSKNSETAAKQPTSQGHSAHQSHRTLHKIRLGVDSANCGLIAKLEDRLQYARFSSFSRVGGGV